MAREFSIAGRNVGDGHPVYFIADIAANHDGDLSRAKDLIYLAKEAGADAAKFQHFRAETIVSDYGFRNLGGQQSHQEKWNKSVFDVYDDASVPADWTAALAETCAAAGIHFFTSPYDFDLVEDVNPYVPAFKIGSGDITWIEFIEYVAAKNKPTIIASGAATIEDVRRAIDAALQVNPTVSLLQCNTNYTGSRENFRYINLNVLKTFRELYPDLVLGLSDHTPGHTTVVGAVAFGARIIEKHFTDDTGREGPDHAFSMTPQAWRDMVDATEEIDLALGDGVKRVERNEEQTCVLQRRGVVAARDLAEGTLLSIDNLVSLRPCPPDALLPYEIDQAFGKRTRRALTKGEHVGRADFVP